MRPASVSDASLVIQVRLAPSDRRVQAVVNARTAADIARLDIVPYLQTPSGFQPISVTTGLPTTPDDPNLLKVSQVSPSIRFDRPVTLTRLHPNSAYRVVAQAYDAQGTLISTADSSSYAQVTVTNDDRPAVPTMLSLRLVTPFNGRTTVTLAASGSAPFDSVLAQLFAVSSGSELSATPLLSVSSASLPYTLTLSNLHANTAYRLKVRATRAGVTLDGSEGSLTLSLGADDAPPATQLTLDTRGYYRGVNACGAEAGQFASDPYSPRSPDPQLPGVYGVAYQYPSEQRMDYYRSKGLTLIRLPFRWERLQPVLYQDLDATELSRLDQVVGYARARGMHVIIDPHNYGRYFNNIVGSAAVPNDAFASLWRKLAAHFNGDRAVWGYGLMCEPHDSQGLWPAAAQAGISAIREIDGGHPIIVPGDNWSKSRSWPADNAGLNVQDPANNLIYETHSYWDVDGSGDYANATPSLSYDLANATPQSGVNDIKPFLDWIKARGARGLAGEYGIPRDDGRWQPVLDNFLAYLDQNHVSGTYWDEGSIAFHYQTTPDGPQLGVLLQHLGPP